MQSAALKIVLSESRDKEGLPRIYPHYDLRVDEHIDPLGELERLVRLRRAVLQSQRGYDLLDIGEQEQALEVWFAARSMAPELEELAFWQALKLADDHQQYEQAAAILKPVLATQANREA
jgi:uncharacterized Ntn-hydrolase superfamily protein